MQDGPAWPKTYFSGTVSPKPLMKTTKVLVKPIQAVLTPPNILTNYNLALGNLIGI